MKKWDDEALFEKAIFLSSQNGQSVSDNVKDLKRAQDALGSRDKECSDLTFDKEVVIDLKPGDTEFVQYRKDRGDSSYSVTRYRFHPKPNTVVVDRGLLRDAHRELGALSSLLGDDDERRRKIMLSLSFALNKDR